MFAQLVFAVWIPLKTAVILVSAGRTKVVRHPPHHPPSEEDDTLARYRLARDDDEADHALALERLCQAAQQERARGGARAARSAARRLREEQDAQ